MKFLKPVSRLTIATLLLALCQASQSHACSVCFGNTDSQLGRGLNWGVFTLLVTIIMVLGVFGVFFYYIAKRSAMYEARQVATVSNRSSGSHPDSATQE